MFSLLSIYRRCYMPLDIHHLTHTCSHAFPLFPTSAKDNPSITARFSVATTQHCPFESLLYAICITPITPDVPNSPQRKDCKPWAFKKEIAPIYPLFHPQRTRKRQSIGSFYKGVEKNMDRCEGCVDRKKTRNELPLS
jgi:hypothetical protein